MDALLGILVLAAGIQVALGVLGAWIMGSKGRSQAGGFVLGFLLSGAGVIVAALLPSTEAEEIKRTARIAQGLARTTSETDATRACPRCAETIKAAATLCRFCGHEVAPLPLPAADPLACPFCARSFTTSEKLATHLRNFHPTEARPGATRPLESNGVVTRAIPTGASVDGPACPQCGIKFLNGDKLHMHVTNFHPQSNG